jgi:hypothetical protein
MYANAGNEIPDSQVHHVLSSNSWKDGKAAVVSKSDNFFCTGCNYTITIEAPIGAKVDVWKHTYGKFISMDFNSQRYDAIEARSN